MNENEFEMIQDAMNAIQISQAEKFVKDFSGNSIFSNNDIIWKIVNNMSYDGHSGSSFGWTMQKCCYYLNNIEEWEKEKQNNVK
jgi:hypothetical protein